MLGEKNTLSKVDIVEEGNLPFKIETVVPQPRDRATGRKRVLLDEAC